MTLDDHETSETLSVEVPEGERPLQVFHNPYGVRGVAGCARGTADAGGQRQLAAGCGIPRTSGSWLIPMPRWGTALIVGA